MAYSTCRTWSCRAPIRRCQDGWQTHGIKYQYWHGYIATHTLHRIHMKGNTHDTATSTGNGAVDSLPCSQDLGCWHRLWASTSDDGGCSRCWVSLRGSMYSVFSNYPIDNSFFPWFRGRVICINLRGKLHTTCRDTARPAAKAWVD